MLAAGSLLDASPQTLLEAAAAAGFEGIGLRLSHDHALATASAAQLARQATDLGVVVHDVEVHRIGTASPDEVTMLAHTAAVLGAQHLLVVSDLDLATHGLAATEDALGDVARRCHAEGVTAALEYMAFTTPRSSADAVALARATDSVVVVDVLHHHRLGEGATELGNVARSGTLGWVQICDAPAAAPIDLIDEARHHRLPPGQGELPLDALLAAVPADVALSVEVQSDHLAARFEPAVRAALLHRACLAAGH